MKSESNDFSVRVLAATIAEARYLADLPLTESAQAAWKSTYPLLLDRKPWLVVKGQAAALAEALRWARLVAARSKAKVIDHEAMNAGMLLWQYAHPLEGERSNHGIVCDVRTRKVFWNEKECPLTLQRFKIFRALVNAKGAALSPINIAEHVGNESGMSDEAIRRTISYLKQSLRDHEMKALADAIQPDGKHIGWYRFQLENKNPQSS